jgi:DNA-binding MarR family transcriptional regulator
MDAPLVVTNRNGEPFAPESRPRVWVSDFGGIPLRQQENSLELVQDCLTCIGISLLVDWDVLIFLHRHGVILCSAEHIARLLSCENAKIGGALDRLESQKLIESSRSSVGVRFYKVVVSLDDPRIGCFQQLLSLAGNRSGRLALAKILKPDKPEAVPEADTYIHIEGKC